MDLSFDAGSMLPLPNRLLMFKLFYKNGESATAALGVESLSQFFLSAKVSYGERTEGENKPYFIKWDSEFSAMF